MFGRGALAERVGELRGRAARLARDLDVLVRRRRHALARVPLVAVGPERKARVLGRGGEVLASQCAARERAPGQDRNVEVPRAARLCQLRLGNVLYAKVLPPSNIVVLWGLCMGRLGHLGGG